MNFSIDPKVQLVLTIIAAIIGAIATGTVGAPPDFNPELWKHIHDWSAYIVGWAAILSPVLPLFSSAKAGPLVSKPADKP